MSKTKKVISIVLAGILIILAVLLPILLKKPKDNSGGGNASAPFVYELSADGKYIYFGEYPQSLKKDSVTVSATPDANGYYLGSDGERYVKKSYTTEQAESLSITAEVIAQYKLNVSNDGRVMNLDTDYYFKVEKIKWRILSAESGKKLIVCDNILQGMAYQPNYAYIDGNYCVTEDGTTAKKDGNVDVYANNYKHSALRAFLTTDFYNSAFTATQKDLIFLTTVDNSAATTYDPSYNPYTCENTQDYIFALSYADVTNTSYGFETDAYKQDINRSWNTTDYAKITGAITYTSEYIEAEIDDEERALFTPYIGSGGMWLRSSFSDNSSRACVVFIGFAVGNGVVNHPSNGAVPALQISLQD